MKRQFRQLDKETKEKISRSNKGKIKSDLHKQHISQAMRKYWSQIPNQPTDISMDKFLGKQTT